MAIQVIDSVAYDNNKFVYWYRVDFGLRGYSECALAISESSAKIDNLDDAFFISDFITDININSNEILLTLHHDSYRLKEENILNKMKIALKNNGDPLNSFRFRLDN